MIHSFRGRLTFLTLTVLAISLILFGFLMAYVLQYQTLRSVDDDLRARAVGPGRPGRGPFGQGRPPEERQPIMPPLPGIPGNQYQRFADIRRPRHFAADYMNDATDEPFDKDALARAGKGGPSFSDTTFKGIPIRVFTLPERRGGQIQGFTQVARDMSDIEQIRRSLVWTLVIFLPAALLIAGAGAMILTGRAIKPIDDMRKLAAEISADHLEKRIPIRGSDELARLGESFNEMVDRLERSFVQLRESYELQRRFTADASHEIRTPLTRLKLALDSAPENWRKDPNYQNAVASVENMTKLVHELLVLARADSGQTQLLLDELDLRVVASDTINRLSAQGDRIEVEFADHPILVKGDSNQLERVILNLIENALRYSNGKVRVKVTTSNTEALVEVSDQGPGVGAEHLSHLTERFYRVDESRTREDGGYGLGLAICETIVAAHGGRLQLESDLGESFIAKIFLPISKSNKNQIQEA